MLDSEGNEEVRTVGSPQGSVVSPMLANLFLHYVFDKWMEINFPDIKFERYVDDIVIHCKTERQAEFLLERISKRMAECKLTVHPKKTKIVYCSDSNRKMKTGRAVKFNFLGYEFMPRRSKT